MEQQLTTMLLAEGEASESGAPAGQPGPQGCQQMSGMLLPLLLMFVIIYFLIIRPQQKQQKRHREMITALKKGDKVITNSGIFGTITGVTDLALTVEIAKNVHVKFLRSHVAGLQPDPAEKNQEAGPVIPGDTK